MAKRPRKLIVSISSAALPTLNEIWDWNSERYGSEHAEQYILFLKTETKKPGTAYPTGKIVKGFPALRYLTIRRNRKGHGHIAILRD